MTWQVLVNIAARVRNLMICERSSTRPFRRPETWCQERSTKAGTWPVSCKVSPLHSGGAGNSPGAFSCLRRDRPPRDRLSSLRPESFLPESLLPASLLLASLRPLPVSLLSGLLLLELPLSGLPASVLRDPAFFFFEREAGLASDASCGASLLASPTKGIGLPISFSIANF